MNETDEILYKRFLSENDQAAFATIFDRHSDKLVHYLYALVGSREDAEELMLDAFAVAASGTTRFHGKHGAGFKTWLYGIAKNKAKMYLRKQRAATVPLMDNDELESAEKPEETVLLDEKIRHLHKALSSIREEYREALYLMYFEQMKPDEISVVMKKSTKQIYNLLNRGRQACREQLEKMGVADLYDDI